MMSRAELLPYPVEPARRWPISICCIACAETRKYVHPLTAELAGWRPLRKVISGDASSSPPLREKYDGLCPMCASNRPY